jgi:8-oxo-dGTP diphosphatase
VEVLNKEQQMDEQEFLKNYDASKYVRPIGVPADIVIFTITTEEITSVTKTLPKRELKVMLIKRKGHPDKGKWALPGGFSSQNETMLEAAKRELKEETGIEDLHIEQFGIYDKPGRDKRGWVISIAYVALVHEQYVEKRKAADDAEDVQLFTIEELNSLDIAFDHRLIISDALNNIQKQILTSTIAKEFLPEEFTIAELYNVIKTVLPDFSEETSNFRRNILRSKTRKGIVTEVYDLTGKPKTTKEFSQRAAQLYKFTNFVPKLSFYD